MRATTPKVMSGKAQQLRAQRGAIQCHGVPGDADETNPLFKGRDWIRQCQVWKQKYPVVTAKHYETVEEGCTNIYALRQEQQRTTP